MSQQERIKVIFIGPSKVGKTTLVNSLSNNADHPSVEYKETCATRVLDFDLSVTGPMKRQTKVVAEVWDVSGNPKYQSCWPAIYHEAQAAVYVMNPEVRNQERELEFWHKNFAEKAKIPDVCSLVFVHHSSAPTKQGAECKPKSSAMPKCLQACRILETSLDFKSEDYKREFERLLESVLQLKRQVEEDKVLASARDKAMSSQPLQIGATQQQH